MARRKKRMQQAQQQQAGPASIQHQEPPVDTQTPPVQTQGVEPGHAPGTKALFFWPADRPMPTEYVKLRYTPLPCPACRRVRFDNLSQAVACTSSGRDTAWFRCRACGHQFELPVRHVDA